MPKATHSPKRAKATNKTAQVISKTEFAGKGALVQAVGLVLFIIFLFLPFGGWVIGLILLIVFLAIGSNLSKRWTCSKCGNALTSQEVRLCPTCGAKVG